MMDMEVFSTQPAFEVARNAVKEEDGVPRIFEPACLMGLVVMLSALVVLLFQLAVSLAVKITVPPLSRKSVFLVGGFQEMSFSLSSSKITDAPNYFASKTLPTPIQRP